MAKTKFYLESNYKAIFSDSKTYRFAIREDEPITKLPYPEFYDVDIFGVGGLCNGKCPYCYLSAVPNGGHVENAVEKIFEYFGFMTDNERPFQVALPGSGEGYLHPEFLDILDAFHSLGIVPNYTTNGMWSQDDEYNTHALMSKTRDVCGGVAVTCHPHLRRYWENALFILKKYRIKTNVHFVISDISSVDEFLHSFYDWNDYFDSAVLLPYGVQGHAKKEKEIAWDYLMNNFPDTKKISFGANFYPYILDDKSGKLNLSLYKEKDFSGFLDLSTMKLHESSWVF